MFTQGFQRPTFAGSQFNQVPVFSSQVAAPVAAPAAQPGGTTQPRPLNLTPQQTQSIRAHVAANAPLVTFRI